MSLSEIVQVNITRETTSVSRAGFGTLLIVGPNVNTDSRLEYFTSAADAKLKIVGSATVEEDLIDAVFAQNPSVVRIALGALQASKTVVIAGTMTAGTITGTVNGTDYAEVFDTDTDTTLDNLAAAMQADADVLTAVNTLGTIVVTPTSGAVVGVSYDITAATGLTGVTETATELAETYATALTAINTEQSDWYGIAAATRTTAKQILVADWTETNKRFFIVGSGDFHIIDQADGVDTTSIAYYAKADSLDRTAVIYSAVAATKGIEAAYFGKLLTLDPGAYTGMFKTLATITVDTLTSTQSTNARDKNANVYESIGGVNITQEGKVGSGEFIDVIIFIDWLTARVQESVYATLVNMPKVPYTNVGITMVESAIEQPLIVGQNRGGISPTLFDDDDVQIGGYVISVPALADVPTADKTARLLQDVNFTAWLAGAIHTVQINGVVTV